MARGKQNIDEQDVGVSVDTTAETTETTTPTPAPAQTVAVPAKPKRKFAPTDTITCRSVCYGELILEGYKTKILYTWANAGDVADVEYQDLQALQSRKSRFLTAPLFIIEDEDLVEQWSSMLKPIYSKIEEEDFDKILSLPTSKLKSRLKALPDGMKTSIKSFAAAKIQSGEFDSINRIKVIDEVLGTELMSTIG